MTRASGIGSSEVVGLYGTSKTPPSVSSGQVLSGNAERIGRRKHGMPDAATAPTVSAWSHRGRCRAAEFFLTIADGFGGQDLLGGSFHGETRNQKAARGAFWRARARFGDAVDFDRVGCAESLRVRRSRGRKSAC